MAQQKRSVHHDYYHLPEEEIQDLVKRSQQGDEDALAYLLKIFENFIQKYVNLLYHGQLGLHNNDIRQFLKLFVNNTRLKQRLGQNKLNMHDRQELQTIWHGFNWMITRYNEESDVRQTVEMAFIDTVQRYVRKGEVPFSGYIYRYFLFIMQKYMKDILIDQLGRKSFPLRVEEDFDDDDEQDTPTPGFDIPAEPSAEDMMGTHEIGENWVFGDVMFPFDHLNPQERQLIRWYYIEKHNLTTIADRMAESSNKISEHIATARRKLAEAIKNDPELDEWHLLVQDYD